MNLDTKKMEEEELIDIDLTYNFLQGEEDKKCEEPTAILLTKSDLDQTSRFAKRKGKRRGKTRDNVLNTATSMTEVGDNLLLMKQQASVTEKKVCEGVIGKNGAKNVTFGIDIVSINLIDDAKQQVHGSFYCKWRYLCYRPKDEIWNSDTNQWIDEPWEIPTSDGWMLSNLISIINCQKRFFPENEEVKDGQTCTWLAVTLKVDGVFGQRFLLQRFPFDKQSIFFTFSFWTVPYQQRGELLQGRLEIKEDVGWNCRLQPGGFRCSDEWSVLERKAYVDCRTTSEDPKFGRGYTMVDVELKIKRKPGFVMWNVVIPTYIVLLLGFIGNLVSRQLEFDRFAHVGTLVLTLFAIKFSISFALPKIGYPTTLDLFMLIGTVLLLGLASQIAITSYWDDYVAQVDSDIITVGTLCGVWTIVTINLKRLSNIVPVLFPVGEDVQIKRDLI